MELSPESVSSTTFKIVKKGCDPDEVKSYLAQIASSFEAMQKHAAAMEARARAATARLQEIAAQPQTNAPGPGNEEAAESISRALLLAQRTADSTVRDATLEANQITVKAKVEAQVMIDGAQSMLNRLLDEAKADARRSAEVERVKIQSEVDSLLARRDFLLGDVEELEQHIVTQRERIREVASALSDIVAKAPGGLADLRRPVMSAVGDETEVSDTETDSAHEASAMPAPAPDDHIDLDLDHIDLDLDVDRTPAWSAIPPDVAALGSGDDNTPMIMVPTQHSDALVVAAHSEAAAEGAYDVTKPMPRVRYAPGDDLEFGADQSA